MEPLSQSAAHTLWISSSEKLARKPAPTEYTGITVVVFVKCAAFNAPPSTSEWKIVFTAVSAFLHFDFSRSLRLRLIEYEHGL
ncbi:unnamed protein product [Nippostrongylus brasiliensis]|uniref:Uncharacterized protein n=1 Tax=Nippostrongylus brasiliensis TaxID=27835 RepID=A0A0N4XD44_NIPBR|nr:unnamed protein product [Nippostrongylus brasiliensis]